MQTFKFYEKYIFDSRHFYSSPPRQKETIHSPQGNVFSKIYPPAKRRREETILSYNEIRKISIQRKISFKVGITYQKKGVPGVEIMTSTVFDHFYSIFTQVFAFFQEVNA